MKTATQRFLFGLLSSALFATGLARAASFFDPVTRELAEMGRTVTSTAPDCVSICNVPDADS